MADAVAPPGVTTGTPGWMPFRPTGLHPSPAMYRSLACTVASEPVVHFSSPMPQWRKANRPDSVAEQTPANALLQGLAEMDYRCRAAPVDRQRAREAAATFRPFWRDVF